MHALTRHQAIMKNANSNVQAKRISFVCENAEDKISGGYIYNDLIFQHLRAQGWTIDMFTPEQSLLINQSDHVVVDSIAIEEFAVKWSDIDYSFTPILLCHLPPEKQVNTDAQVSKRYLQLKKMIDNSKIITTGSTCSSYMSENYDISADRLQEVRPGLLDNWQTKDRYSSVPYRLLVVANIIPNKGYEMLIEMINNIKELDWQLDIYGDNRFAPDYAQQILTSIEELGDKRVVYRGTANQSDINRAMVNADLFIQLSPYEPYSMVSLEAISSGLPMLSAQSGEMPEFNKSGMVRYIDEHTSKSATQALSNLLTHPSEYKNITPQIKPETRKWTQVADEFARVIEAFNE